MLVSKGFLRDEKWYEDLGHIAIGLVPFWGWFREQAQLPPATERLPVMQILRGRPGRGTYKSYPSTHQDLDGEKFGREYWAAERVLDMRRDEFGYAVGDVLRTLALIGVVIWLAI